MAQLPALEIEGEYLFGCAAISRYLNYCNTNTADKSEHAQIAQVQIHTDTDYEVDKYTSAIYLQLMGYVPHE
jgi:hypothetical protein